MSKGRWRLALTIAAIASAIVTAVAQGGPARTTGYQAGNYYIVQIAGEPAVTYEGGVAGLPATKPAKGEKIDPQDANVQRYVAHLNARHDAVLARVGGAQKIYDYGYALNGFAAYLTPAQVAKLEKMKDVVSIEEAEEWHPATATTPEFLGVTGPNGLWAQLGGPQSGTNQANATGAGEGIVVGIIDTGIWPEHPSVSDRVDGKLMYKPLPGNRWKGKCAAPGADDPTRNVVDGSWTGNLCNNKLVGARFFLETREALAGPITAPDFRSPRDANGHGTHVGTTAAGNHGIQPTGDASAFDRISGIAPRARLAAYKVCWPSCFTPDSAAAFDAAVADGVDVINFSISGSTSAVTGFVMDATRRAAEAGVFVAMSAGNSGPGASTVAHVAPWVTTVANTTHPRSGQAKVTVDGVDYTGGSLNGGIGPATAIYAGDAALPGVSLNDARLCLLPADRAAGSQTPTLDPAKVAGKIVVCDRGVNVLVNKAAAVKNAGGVGMILANGLGSADTVFALMHTIPTVHVNTVAGDAIRAAVMGKSVSATIHPFALVTVAAPFISGSSSRGPAVGGGGNLLKPDLAAPGSDILAGYSPVPGGRLFDVISGTSMASPHVAGAAALMKHRHPSWTPMMIKSALMTSGIDILGTSGSAQAFAQGAGNIRPTEAANPGLVFEHGPADWSRYICGVGQATCSNPLNPTDLNGASVAIGAMPGSQAVARTVTSVSATSQTYTATFSGLPGINAAIDKATFTIAPGASETFTMTFTRTTAAFNTYQAGHLTLTSTAGHRVRIPIVIRPVQIAAPTEVSSNGADVSWSVKPGYTGALNAPVVGLTPATETPWTVAQDPDQTFSLADPTGTFSKTITIPANSLFRVGIYEDAITPSDTDLDLYVYLGTSLVGSGTTPTSNEQITLRTGAAPATVTVYVHGWFTNGPSASGTLFDWIVNADAGNTTLSGVGAAATGVAQTHTASFAGLAPGTRYLGEVRYNNGSATIAQTILNVRTP